MLKKKIFEELFFEIYILVLYKNVLSNEDKFWFLVEIVRVIVILIEMNEKGKL